MPTLRAHLLLGFMAVMRSIAIRNQVRSNTGNPSTIAVRGRFIRESHGCDAEKKTIVCCPTITWAYFGFWQLLKSWPVYSF